MLHHYANSEGRSDQWWWFDAINYGSLQIAAAFSFYQLWGRLNLRNQQFGRYIRRYHHHFLTLNAQLRYDY